MGNAGVSPWTIGAVLTVAVVFGGATAVHAETAAARGVLYETLEAPPGEFQTSGARILPGAFLPTGERLAQGTERGSINGYGSLAWMTGQIEVNAQSRVPVDYDTSTFGVGSVAGTFYVRDVAGRVINGDLSGYLDLSPVTSTDCNGKGCPWAWTGGTWSSVTASNATGQFTGIFLIPFEIARTWYYLHPQTGLEKLRTHEFGRQGPMVRLHVELTE